MIVIVSPEIMRHKPMQASDLDHRVLSLDEKLFLYCKIASPALLHWDGDGSHIKKKKAKKNNKERAKEKMK
ncbi:hypothetical protein GQX74_002519 [Glossina fuscipes]|nr:hypothetical protein GQX74_002519 [Glossina fuscipes]